MIINMLIGEADLLLPREIGDEVRLLSACPCQRKSCGDDNIRFGDTFIFQFDGDRRKSEQIIVLVFDFVGIFDRDENDPKVALMQKRPKPCFARRG